MANPAPKPHRFIRAEFDRMARSGVFEANARLELIDGEIIEMPPQSTRHFTAVRLAEEALRAAFPEGYDIRVQGPLAVDDGSEPEPDVAVVRGGPRDYLDEHPRSALLVVEAADTSLGFDRVTKKRLYARNGIPEYWILDLKAGRLEIYRHPEGDDYAQKRIYGAGEAIAPLAAPDAKVEVSDLLP